MSNDDKRVAFFNAMQEVDNPIMTAPYNLEFIVSLFGYKSEIITQLTAFVSAVDFIKKELEGNFGRLFDKNQLKPKMLFQYLDFTTKQMNEKESYMTQKQREVCEMLNLDQGRPDQVPLSEQTLMILDRKNPNAQRIQYLNKKYDSEQSQNQIDEIEKQLARMEERLKYTYRNDSAKYEKLIKPHPHHIQEKARCIYHYNLQQFEAQKLFGCETHYAEIEIINTAVPAVIREMQCFTSDSIQMTKNLVKMLNPEQQTLTLQQFGLDNMQQLEEKCDLGNTDVMGLLTEGLFSESSDSI